MPLFLVLPQGPGLTSPTAHGTAVVIAVIAIIVVVIAAAEPRSTQV